MSDILKNESKVFGAVEFAQAWGVLLSKGHDPARNLRTFKVTADDGSERIAVGLIDYMDADRVIFASQSCGDYESAFAAVGFALDSEV